MLRYGVFVVIEFLLVLVLVWLIIDTVRHPRCRGGRCYSQSRPPTTERPDPPKR